LFYQQLTSKRDLNGSVVNDSPVGCQSRPSLSRSEGQDPSFCLRKRSFEKSELLLFYQQLTSKRDLNGSVVNDSPVGCQSRPSLSRSEGQDPSFCLRKRSFEKSELLLFCQYKSGQDFSQSTFLYPSNYPLQMAVNRLYRPYAVLIYQFADCSKALRYQLLLAERAAEQIAKQESVDAGMRDGCCAGLRMRGNMCKRSVRARKPGFVAFSAGRAGSAPALSEVFRVAAVQLIEGQAVLLTAVEFNEVIQYVYRSAAVGDGFGSLTGAQQRAGIYSFNGRIFQETAQRACLLKAMHAQREIGSSAETHPRAVWVIGLCVADQVDQLFFHGGALLVVCCPYDTMLQRRMTSAGV